MPDVQWDSDASLMRVTNFETTPDSVEELISRGTVRDLVGAFLELPLSRQRGLLLRAVGPDWTQEFDSSAIRELAARPEYTGANGDYDTADLIDDPDVHEVRA
jgi:hypothetical protein